MNIENIEILSCLKKEIAKKNRKMKGIVRGTRSRVGFLEVSNNKDIFIKPMEMDKVFFGDEVEATVFDYETENENLVIDKIIRSDQKIFIGLFSESETGSYVAIDSPYYSKKIRIPKDLKNGARHNQYVKIELIEHPFKRSKPKAKIISIIGDKNAWNIEASYNMSRFNIDTYVDEIINKESNELIESFDNNIFKSRKDLTKLDFFTIDGENTVDIDDAIYVKKLDKKWKLLVAISDVSELLKENSNLDNDAYKRLSTVYLLGKTIPMLSFDLTKTLSLTPFDKKLVLVADITLDLNGDVLNYKFYEATINSKAKLSYNDVSTFLNTGLIESCSENIKNSLKELYELHFLLNNSRAKNNVLPIKRVDYKNILGADRKISEITRLEINESHRMIEEAMLCANKCASNFISNSFNTAIFKIQEGLKDDKIDFIYSFLIKYIKFDKELLFSFEGFKDVIHLIEKLDNSEYLKSFIFLYIKDSEFSSEDKNYYSMGFDSYTYFTSPLRRYSDIIIHRFIKSKIKNKKYDIKKVNYIEHFKNKGDDIQNCVKETEKWMQAEFLKKSPSDLLYKCKITGINKTYFTVVSIDTGIEARVYFNKKIKHNKKGFSFVYDKIEYSILSEVFLKFDYVLDFENSAVFKF